MKERQVLRSAQDDKVEGGKQQGPRISAGLAVLCWVKVTSSSAQAPWAQGETAELGGPAGQGETAGPGAIRAPGVIAEPGERAAAPRSSASSRRYWICRRVALPRQGMHEAQAFPPGCCWCWSAT